MRVNSRFPLLAAHAAVARAHRRKVPVVLVGSSTTAGSGASSKGVSYAAILGRRFREASPAIVVENLGQPGTTAETYLPDARISRIHALAPAAVVHMVGSNDYSRSVSPSAYGATLRDRIAAIDAGLALPCQHVLVQTFARIDVTEPVAPWASYGEQLHAIAADHAACVVLDVSAAFAEVGVGFGGTDPLGLVGPDRIHLSDPGHRFLAELVWAELR